MVSIEKGAFIKPLSLLTLALLVLVSLAPQSVAFVFTFIIEWSVTSTVLALAFVAYLVVPFRRQIEEERQNPLHLPRTPSIAIPSSLFRIFFTISMIFSASQGHSLLTSSFILSPSPFQHPNTFVF